VRAESESTDSFSFSLSMNEGDPEEDSTTTHPVVLPPKSRSDKEHGDEVRSERMKFGGSSSSSIKRLVENITANKGVLAEESRFGNVYRESVGAKGAAKTGSIGSKFGALIDSMRSEKASTSTVHESRTQSQSVNGNDSRSETKRESMGSGDRWSEFTESLMGSERVVVDEEGDDLLSDLFGDKHAAPSMAAEKENGPKEESVSSRAHKLLHSESDDEMEWPWLKQKEPTSQS